MEKITSEAYLFRKKCLLILLYLYYLNGIDYQNITFRSFGFHFDPTCNFKVIIVSEKEHIHKYTSMNMGTPTNGAFAEAADDMPF